MPHNEISTNLQQLVAKIPRGHNIQLLETVLPTIEEIEAELQSEIGEGNDKP
jgi:hypothetical protein